MKIDASVIQRLSQGDREAYTAVFREYYAPLVVYSSRIVKEREIAEDIVQEFFCYLWKQRRQLAEMHSFTTYLYRSTAALGLSLFILICQGRFGKWIDSE